MHELKISAIGNSLGTILPKDLLAALNVGKGDTLYAIQTTDGILLTHNNPDFERQFKLGMEFVSEYSETFHVLAK